MSKHLETIDDHYRENTISHYAFDASDYQCGKSHFNINIRKYCNFNTPYNRRDYYKVCLIIGEGVFKYGEHTLILDRPALFLPCPTIPYEWECLSNQQEGFFCLFNQEFLVEHSTIEFFKKISLFKEWSKPFIFLDEEQLELASTYFKQMYAMAQSDYPLKFEIIRNLLALLLHQALQLKVEDLKLDETPNSTRLYRLFDELLNKQFPLDSPAYPLNLKTASDYATALNVHVNHLNASIKSVTSKTTTQLIKERLFEEAKNLLKNTSWDIAEVGYTLGFDQPTHFNNFFKKNAGVTPLKYKNLI
ncbi:helix-turn-helix domain-containing protein [Myroides odoratimimus]|uniref:helix-turn-helix domain-containing protein n=1 Tax=Myroides odoratimimus TaxID=76832 RepID=UPI0004693883|nr:helix-turn-helix domain-containing protein [Myroides odoratimimus]